MFNLFRSRDKAVRFFLGALLVLVSLSMLTYLIPSYGSGNASDIVIARIGKEDLTMPEVQQVIQANLKGRNLPAEMVPHYIPQMVDNMITQRVMEYEAKRLGFQVTDADIASTIQTVFPSLFPNGQFAGKDAYASMLSQQNLTIPQFENELARQMLVSRLRDIVVEGTIVSPVEIEQEYRRRSEKAKVEYVRLPPDKFKSDVNPTPEEMRKYYESNKAAFVVPEKRSMGLLIIDQAKMEQNYVPSDADLRKVYEQNKDKYRLAERVKVRHILLNTTGKSKEEEAAIKAKAEKLLKQIKGGADFAKLAKENSEDPGSASKGGDLDWVTRGQTVPEFEKTAFTLKPGETSDLVKTQYGYHILQVLQKEQARLKPFEEVKSEIAAEYKKQQVAQLVQDTADKAVAELRKDSTHPEKVAADLGVQYVKADNAAYGDTLPVIGKNLDFEKTLPGLQKGDVSQPVMVEGNKIVVAGILNLAPTHPASFEEAQAEVRDALVKQRSGEIATQKAKDLVAKAQAMGGDLKKAAQSMGLEVKTSGEFTRVGAVEGLGSASYLGDAFTKPAGTLIGPAAMPDGVQAVAKVVSQTQANMAELPMQRDAIRDEIKGRKARERISLFEDGLKQTLMKDGKLKIHQDVLNRLTQNYRG
jgi:peptidyl-prolyl cis-trans isomerase D